MIKLNLLVIIALFLLPTYEQKTPATAGDKISEEIKRLSNVVIEEKLDGTWSIEKTVNGRYVSLSVKLKQSGDQLTGEYGNVSSKESVGKILRSKVTGNTATIEIDCDWGGRGSVRLTILKGNRLRWQVIKRDERKGQFIVLQDEILTKQ